MGNKGFGLFDRPLFKTMKDTIIIFGRSLFINKIKKYIPELIKKYDTMGINSFYESYPKIKYVIFYDKIAAPKQIINNKIITDIKNKDEVYNQKDVTLYKVITNREEFSTNKNILNFYYFSSSMAINWAYLKGYKNVVLAGIDLENNLHFDNPLDKPNISEEVLFKARKYMENICSKYVNLFQLNPDSNIRLRKISIKEILK